MSYTRPNCLKYFTNGQGIRMRDAILNSPVLQPVLNCNCTVAAFLGKSTICSTETASYTIPCNNSSFTVSSNLQVISSTSNSITIKAANSSVNGSAFVEASINGNAYQKEIWVGKPKADIQLTPEGNYVFMELVGVNSDIHEQNITAIKWETESSTGSATMGQLIDRFENLAHGNNDNWSINAKITLTNDCGSTILYKYIIPPEPQPCEGNYRITKNNRNEYITYRIIDPCARSTTKSKTEKVKDKEIKEAVLFDIYGLRIKTYSKNSFNTNYLKKGVYIFKVRINEEVITKKIIVN
ncbi:T9SS type A sorting domain-containing protein [Salinimicrobium gaetbulicola]|uniref:T9SS type A sorting domain-containing protein n=1 Tax=Salinimicrobium gaetbulicola TaxID=999702 RepID=A0ABW3IGQ0_9FLAO